MNVRKLPLIVGIGILALAPGCDDNARVANVSERAADRQAQQNQEMGRLVQADVNARRETVAAERELQARQASVDNQRDALEAERRQIAEQRRSDSWLSEASAGLGILLFGGLVIAFCWWLVFGLRSADTTDEDLRELLIQELTAEAPEQRLIDPRPKSTASDCKALTLSGVEENPGSLLAEEKA